MVALGSYSPIVLRPLGISVPVYPIKGYSITVPITDAGGAPESTVMDETYKVAITRLGDRIRVGGTAEISGYDLRLHAARRGDARAFGRRPLPGRRRPVQGDLLVRAAADDAGRPADHRRRPDLPNLYLNTGHGTLGWTMACGSGRVLADIISGASRRSTSASSGFRGTAETPSCSKASICRQFR